MPPSSSVNDRLFAEWLLKFGDANLKLAVMDCALVKWFEKKETKNPISLFDDCDLFAKIKANSSLRDGFSRHSLTFDLNEERNNT